MTTVSAVMRRSYSPTMFDDLNLPAHTRAWDKPTAVTTLTFVGELTDAQVDAVWARMESTNDADQAARAVLRADHDALAEDDPLRRLYDYQLDK